VICLSTGCEKFQKNADLAVRSIREEHGVELTFDADGVEWIDDHINRLSGRLAPEFLHPYVDVLGAFLGESLIRTYGGAWVERDGEWGVQITEHVWAAPFTKTFKQFTNGPRDSVASLFGVIAHCF